jgi:Xaa-Pro aminopeptidase
LEGRLERLRLLFDDAGFDCMLVTKAENVRYLCGFRGSSGAALVTLDESILITDGRYREQASRETTDWDVRIHTSGIAEAVAKMVPRNTRCGFEVTVSFELYRRLVDSAGDSFSLDPVEGAVESLRALKDSGEIQLMKAAIQCASAAFEEASGMFAEGAVERRLAAELDYRMVLAGADGPAFDTVVASGPNSSLPHSPLTDRRLEAGDLVVVDFGAVKDGYRSDTTRTLLINSSGTDDVRKSEALSAVKAAREAALEALTPGVKALNVDAAARDRLAELGLVEHFTHSLGHGVGLETHEKPTLSAVSDDTLEPGMVFTIEPGVYIEGLGGVRIEDIVLMTPDGPEILT